MKKPAPNGFAEADRFIHHVPWQYPIGYGGEFDKPPVNAFQAGGSSLDRPERPPLPEARLHPSSSAGTDTDLPTTCSCIWLEWLSSGNRRQGAREHLACRPSSIGPVGSQSFRSLPIALRHPLATSCSRLHERHSKGVVRAHKVRVGAPPLQMGQQA
jgi:hypothetical protein